MELSLRYHPAPQRPACAALLRGADLAAWLRELGRWNLPAEQLRCYLVPESIRSVRPAGLLVVVEGGALPPHVAEPYGAEAGQRLFVPVQATLWPATTPAELAAALLWPQQLLHPRIGLVGFDTTDELDLATLLDCGPAEPTDWSRALPGVAARPPLQQLRVLAPTAAEVVESLQSDIGREPLTALLPPAETAPSTWQKKLDGLRQRLLKATIAYVRRWRKASGERAATAAGVSKALRIIGLVAVSVVVLGLLGSLVASFSTAHGSGGIGVLLLVLIRVLNALFKKQETVPQRFGLPPRAAPLSDTGMAAKLEKWLTGNLEELEKKRQNEIERLLRLFDDNPAEALKYAIPLGGPYQPRGAAPPSAQLGARDTSFSLSRLGGGTSADVWNLGNYQFELRRQYLAAAEQEARAQRYQQAAYIHAHLLGDYRSAANVLEQGGLFRAAATLHKDHLHNPAGAAQCLERGQLLLEAAELFAELGQHEKAGDLHTQLAQPQLAARHYERGVAVLLDGQDHPAAARLLASKLQAPARAQQVLLQGWASPKQPETCLAQYFEVVAATPDGDLTGCVRTVFDQHTPRERQLPLLHVLATFAEKHPDPALLHTSREVAYEITSAEASAGNLAPLALLRRFLPDDRLVAADCSRYATSQPPPAVPAAAAPLSYSQLDAAIEWLDAVSHRQQWVAVGRRAERLHLARGNWYGHLEYYSWTEPVSDGAAVVLVADAYHGARIVLRVSESVALETKVLPKNKHFAEALTVECPSWLPPWPTRVALLPDGETATARLQHEATLVPVQRYGAAGQLLSQFLFKPHDGSSPLAGERGWPCELIYHNGTYYTYWDNQLLAFADDRRHTHHLDHQIVQLVRSPYAAELQLAVALTEGIAIWQPTLPTGSQLTQPIASHDTASVGLSFVGPEHLVSVAHQQATLYHLAPAGARLLSTIATGNELVAVLPTGTRQQFALLEATGRLTLHEVPAQS